MDVGRSQRFDGAGRAPGVYFEEGFPARRPVFRSGIPLFVGFVRERSAGRSGMPACISAQRWDPMLFSEVALGRPVPGSFLVSAVRGFFENGGTECHVLPIPWPREGNAVLARELGRAFEFGGVLDDLEGADLVCVPDAAMVASSPDGNAAAWEVQATVLEYCERLKDRFALLDGLPAPSVHGSGEPVDVVIAQGRALGSSFGALYFPWINAQEPGYRQAAPGPKRLYPRRPEQRARLSVRSGAVPSAVPPCGHVAGVFARSDARFGVHKAPANELVEGVVDLSFAVDDDSQARLNDAGINCLRHFPGRGLRVWGARTLSRQPAWRYINVRRVFTSLVRWIEQNLRDLVFEPNLPGLWVRVKYRLETICEAWFHTGALRGESPEQAYFVKCDAETNTPDDREAGRLVAEIGLAVEVPAEFIVVRITQSVSGVEITVPGLVA